MQLVITMHTVRQGIHRFAVNYARENRWKELNKADLQQIATIFQNYICFSYVRAWLVIVWSKHGLVDSSLFSSHCDSSTVAVRNDKHVTWTA